MKFRRTGLAVIIAVSTGIAGVVGAATSEVRGAARDRVRGHRIVVSGDGAAETSFGDDTARSLEVLTRFEVSRPPIRIASVRIGLVRTSGRGPVRVAVRVRRADADREPGVSLTYQEYVIDDVPAGLPGRWFWLPISGDGPVATGSAVWVGVAWDPDLAPGLAVLVDTSGAETHEIRFRRDPDDVFGTLREEVPDATALLVWAAIHPGLTGGCSYSLGPSTRTSAAFEFSGSVGVGTRSHCQWTAEATDPWIHVLDHGTGMGGGSFSYTVDANPHPYTRYGGVRVGDAVLAIAQTCRGLSRSPQESVFTAGGGEGSVTVDAPAVCAWRAESDEAWVQVVAGHRGLGPGEVRYLVEPNTTGSERGTFVVVGGRPHRVVQSP